MELGKIKVGEVLSTTYYMTVTGKDAGKQEIYVKDNHGNNFTMRGKSLIESSLNSASQFDTEKKVSRTEMIEVLESAGDSVFTVKFVKQDGKDRTMIARLVGGEPKMGRTNVMDLEIATGHPLRQVDNRTTYELILKGTKYSLKK